jgi:DHA1 family multidrug resistance protein-like MFS transporter
MQRWKINLTVLWIGQFLVLSGFTMITPFMPFYLQELGMTEPHLIAKWAGFIFAANFLTGFIFQPIWGGLADRYGSKIMLLRSGFGMAIVIILMGFATNAWQLLLLRMLNGVIAGFSPAAVSFISTNTPSHRMGFAIGTLQSGGIAGMILGPLIGGLMAEWIGYRFIFYITGALLLIAACLAWWLVKETVSPQSKVDQPKIKFIAGVKKLLSIPQITLLLSITIAIQFSLLMAYPIIPLFVQELHGNGAGLAFYTGLVASITGFSNMIAAPLFGRLSDRIRPEKILVMCLLGAAIFFIPHYWVSNISQLFIVRFLLGVFIGGLIPIVYHLTEKYTPIEMRARSFGLNSSALSLGNMLGPLVGGALYGIMTIREIFLIPAILLLANAIWTFLQFPALKQTADQKHLPSDSRELKQKQDHEY